MGSEMCIRDSFSTEGRGLIQTHYPDHPVMQALVNGDREAFYEAEIAMRDGAGYPPFGRLAAIVISANKRPEAEDYARSLALAAPDAKNIAVLGPVEAPLAIIRGRHRQRLLVKAARERRTCKDFSRRGSMRPRRRAGA